MPDHEQVKHSGTVGDIFAHRFVLELPQGNVLADLGPKGAKSFRLKKGERVHIEGEKKPSEIKVKTISLEGGKAVDMDHPSPKHEQDDVDPKIALQAAENAGYFVIGDPRRKPKHFDVRARNPKGKIVDLHIEFDGQISKEKAVKKG